VPRYAPCGKWAYNYMPLISEVPFTIKHLLQYDMDFDTCDHPNMIGTEVERRTVAAMLTLIERERDG
jgi:hypothetical protein